MYYNVYMPVISVRVSDEWLAAVDAECELRVWKRNAAIVNLVRQALSGRGVEGHAPVSAGVSGAQSGTRCHSGRETRSQGGTSLAEQESSPAAPINQDGPVAQKDRAHAGVNLGEAVGSSPARSINTCSICGSMSGSHQRWCKR